MCQYIVFCDENCSFAFENKFTSMPVLHNPKYLGSRPFKDPKSRQVQFSCLYSLHFQFLQCRLLLYITCTEAEFFVNQCTCTVFYLRSCHLRMTLGRAPLSNKHTYYRDIEKSSVLEFQNNLWWVRNRVGKGLQHRLARLHRLADSISWNRFLGS